jgi:hypothetical protein
VPVPAQPGVEPLPVRLPPEIYLQAIRFNAVLGRELRLDPPRTQGVSTEWFSLSAFLDGDRAAAHRFVDYERHEFDRVYRILLVGWLDDVVEYIAAANWLGLAKREATRLFRVPRELLWRRLDQLAARAAVDLHAAIDRGDALAFETAQRSLREAHIAGNDLSVRWMQDLLTVIADQEGEPAVLKVIEISYERIWKKRYHLWFQMSTHERLALSAEGMRAHYGGPGRRGDFQVEEREDAYVMLFDPCGTGGVMRRGDVTTGEAPFITAEAMGTNREPTAWTWGLTGVSWYCAHCPLLLEYFPLRDLGQVLRPVLYDPDPARPTRWVVYKEMSPQSQEGPSRERV